MQVLLLASKFHACPVYKLIFNVFVIAVILCVHASWVIFPRSPRTRPAAPRAHVMRDIVD